MSFKSKDLHYEKQEPAFLRRLKGAYDANDGRSNVQIARPKKDRLKTGDGDDDEPLILDENGDVVGKKEFDGMVNGHDKVEDKGDKAKESTDAPSTMDAEAEPKREEKQQLASIGGGGRKRKQIKAIGGGSEDGDEAERGHGSTKDPDSRQSTNKSKAERPGSKNESSTTVNKTTTDKPKKKVKKIKLSFDDPE